MSSPTDSTTETAPNRTTPTGIGPLDWALGWAYYLTVGGIAFLVSMVICVTVVLPQLSPGSELPVFALWLIATVYFIGKTR